MGSDPHVFGLFVQLQRQAVRILEECHSLSGELILVREVADYPLHQREAPEADLFL